MTEKEFWRSASNWGMICGLALFVVSLISWGLELEANNKTWTIQLLHFLVICPLLLYTGFRNARLSGPQGYSYGRAVGYIFAMMMFAGIVAGVGQFLMANFIARDYYDALYSAQVNAMVAVSPSLAEMADRMVRMLANPFVLILGSVFDLVIKGGFLGLILAAFIKKNPDFFADASAVDNNNEPING